MNTTSSSSRLQYLDWVRGLGAVIMLHGHVWDSFLRDDLRSGGPYILSQFLGGMPPAIFLFLTGVTLAFLMDSSERKAMARTAPTMITRSSVPTKRYVGIRKAEPASLMPRMLMSVRISRIARQRPRVWGWRRGKADTRAPTPAAMPTAAFRM